jgi:PHD/YefM family antitoxin component YafN of YafNO toxin-antitoxin module
MTSVKSAEFQKNFGTYKRLALQQPVTITIHGQDTLVLLSKRKYDLLTSEPDQRKVTADAHPAQDRDQSQRNTQSEQTNILTAEELQRINEMFRGGITYREV